MRIRIFYNRKKETRKKNRMGNWRGDRNERSKSRREKKRKRHELRSVSWKSRENCNVVWFLVRLGKAKQFTRRNEFGGNTRDTQNAFTLV